MQLFIHSQSKPQCQYNFKVKKILDTYIQPNELVRTNLTDKTIYQIYRFHQILRLMSCSNRSNLVWIGLSLLEISNDSGEDEWYVKCQKRQLNISCQIN